MQHHASDDPFEREPLDSSRIPGDSPPRRPLASSYDYQPDSSPYYDASPRHHRSRPDSFSRIQSQESRRHSRSLFDNHGGSYHNRLPGGAPVPPPHGDNTYYTRGPPAHAEDMGYGYARNHQSTTTPGADNFSASASGGMAGIAYNVAERNARDSGMRAANQLPPPPSRTAQGNGSNYGGGYMYDGYSGGRPTSLAMRSQSSSLHSLGYPADAPADDPYQGYSSSSRRLGEVNPNEIEDDGDDGLYYPKHSQRNSMLSSAANSDRGTRQAFGAAAAVGGAAAAGGAMGGLLNRNRDGGPEYNLADGTEKHWGKKEGMSKKARWAIIIGVAFVIIGAVVGGVVGGMVAGNEDHGKAGASGDSAKEDQRKNGDLDLHSGDIKALLNNPDLHKVFPGMDYTPLNAQYPDCLENPPSQNNITRDLAVLSQLTNRVRLYGTDCNQTQMLVHAINQLDLKGDMKIWLGVWQDGNKTTNARQLKGMWDVLDEYGDEPFEGLIVANEILFREEMTVNELGNLLDKVRSNLTDRDLDLPVATSDLGDDWKQALASKSDYIMSNIHPFFAGVAASKAADWTMSFWENNNSGFFKKDSKKNIISETGWPTGGGTDCGTDKVTHCPNGAVAGVDELNQFMSDFVCPALKNGTNYFWFSAFDEPWKIQFNEKGKEWEDKWGLMDVDRNLKKGVKIPDCDGKEVS